MPDCSSIQKSLAWCQGRPQYAGIRRRLYYAAKANIVGWPQLPRDGQGRPAGATYDGIFVLATDKEWQYIDILPEKSQLTSETQGEYPMQSQLNKLVVVHPGIEEEATEFAAYIAGNDCVFLVEDMQGLIHVVGHEHFPLKVSVSQDTGQGPTGNTSTTITVEATDEVPAPIYEGLLVIEDREMTMAPANYTPSSFTQI